MTRDLFSSSEGVVQSVKKLIVWIRFCFLLSVFILASNVIFTTDCKKTRCCVSLCENDNRSSDYASLSWHKFPNDSKLHKIWLDRIRRKDFNPIKYQFSLQCSLHLGLLPHWLQTSVPCLWRLGIEYKSFTPMSQAGFHSVFELLGGTVEPKPRWASKYLAIKERNEVRNICQYLALVVCCVYKMQWVARGSTAPVFVAAGIFE